MTMIGLKRTFAGFALLALAGCGNILPPPAAPPKLYHLTPASDFPAAPRAVPEQLLVGDPTAEAALDTTRVALSRTPTTLDYFADAAWTDRLTVMVQGLLVASLDNSRRFAAVGPQSGALRGDVVLSVELRHFEAAYAGDGPPHWRIEIAAKLVRFPERTIVAARNFSGDAAAAHNDLPAIIDASDTAWHGVASAIADWAAGALPQPVR